MNLAAIAVVLACTVGIVLSTFIYIQQLRADKLEKRVDELMWHVNTQIVMLKDECNRLHDSVRKLKEEKGEVVGRRMFLDQ